MDKPFREQVESSLHLIFKDYLDRRPEFNHTELLKCLGTFSARVAKLLSSVKNRSESDKLDKLWEYEKGLFDDLGGRDMLPPIKFPHFPEPAANVPNKKQKIALPSSASSVVVDSEPLPLTSKDDKPEEKLESETPESGNDTGAQVSDVGTGVNSDNAVLGSVFLYE